jgi:uncharacterized phage-associated protein
VVRIHSPRPTNLVDSAGFLRGFGRSCFWGCCPRCPKWARVGVDKQDLDRKSARPKDHRHSDLGDRQFPRGRPRGRAIRVADRVAGPFAWQTAWHLLTLHSGTARIQVAIVHDVAAYILSKHGPMSAMKLQKLLYYSQAWGLVWDEKPLFDARVEAWANGPVVPEIYQRHRGIFMLGKSWSKGDPEALDQDERETVTAVLDYYGDKSSLWLSNLTHREDPWLHARTGLAPGERGNQEITHAAMEEYYGGLT